ncbi:MAG TPA: Rpp14/Pop5 family protein [archaeon]|nr:Rpp14/Pop5 family protein [archaeon]
MNQKEKLKILSPTLREKHRYVKVKIISEEPATYSDLESAIYKTFLEFYGEDGVSKLSLWIVKNLFDEKEQTLVVRCNNTSIQKVIAGLGLLNRLGDSRLIIKVLKISGTINGVNKR